MSGVIKIERDGDEIKGKAKTMKGNRHPSGHQLSLTDMEGNVVKETEIKKSGSFLIEGIPKGEYKVVVGRKKKKPVKPIENEDRAPEQAPAVQTTSEEEPAREEEEPEPQVQGTTTVPVPEAAHEEPNPRLVGKEEPESASKALPEEAQPELTKEDEPPKVTTTEVVEEEESSKLRNNNIETPTNTGLLCGCW